MKSKHGIYLRDKDLTAEKLLEEIQIEDELPSEAGNAFRAVINKYVLGYREIAILADWLFFYLQMPGREREEFVTSLLIEEATELTINCVGCGEPILDNQSSVDDRHSTCL